MPGLSRDVGFSLFHHGTGGQGQQSQQTQHHRNDSFCLFHVPFLSHGTALIAFSHTEDYNMRLHRRHRLVFFYCITPAGIVKTNLPTKSMRCDLHASGGLGIQIPDTLPGLR